MDTNFEKLLEGMKSKSEKVKVVKDGWKTGKNPLTQEKFEWTDAISANNHIPQVIPQIISEVAREAAEPLLVLTGLLTQMPYSPRIETIMGSMGIVSAADLGEAQEYPEVQLSMGGSSRVAKIGKSGLKFKVTEEMMRYSEFDVINLYVNACGKALARHKETKVAKHITEMGLHVFDNAQPLNSLLGVTHGRDSAGNANGSITWDDMFDLFGVVINNGFMPNLLIMHPLTWVLFMKDPVLRSFALAAGGGTWWGSYNGNPAGRAPWNTPAMNGPSNGQAVVPAGVSSSPTQLEGMPQVPSLNSSPNFPNYFLPFAFSIVISPFIFYNPDDKTTDIVVCDRSELGVLLVDEPVTVSEWEDMSRDIFFVKLRERYSIAIHHEGLAIAVARNVVCVPNEIVLPARATIDVSSLPAIPATTAVL